jgi:hypothetical protein
MASSGSSSVAAVIAPSMLSSDFANLASEAKRMLDCGADWLHMDVMVRHLVCGTKSQCLICRPFLFHAGWVSDARVFLCFPHAY